MPPDYSAGSTGTSRTPGRLSRSQTRHLDKPDIWINQAWISQACLHYPKQPGCRERASPRASPGDRYTCYHTLCCLEETGIIRAASLPRRETSRAGSTPEFPPLAPSSDQRAARHGARGRSECFLEAPRDAESEFPAWDY